MVYHYMNVGHIGYPCPWILPSVKTGQQLYTHAIVTHRAGVMTGGTSRASSGFSAALPLPFFPAGLLPPSSCKHMHAHNAMSLGDRSTQGAAQEDQKHRQARQSGAQHVDGEDWMRQQRRQQSSSRQYTAKRTTQVLAQRHAGQAALTCWGWAGRAACSCGGGAALAFALSLSLRAASAFSTSCKHTGTCMHITPWVSGIELHKVLHWRMKSTGRQGCQVAGGTSCPLTLNHT